MNQSLLFPMHNAYQNTGVTWLGEIPAHWKFKKNKYLFTEKKLTVGKQSSDYTLLSLTLKGVIARDMDNPQGKFPAEFNTYKIVNPNDLIFCLFDIEETPRTIGLAQQQGMITGAYTVMECQPEVSARYLSYFYLYLDTDKKLKPLYTGLRKVIQRDTFMSIRSPLPPSDEQERIANFLDQKTAEIEEAITKKQRLIELLKEQKTILINQAVTKGLNPNVPMRDSGVDWIGEVPAHWSFPQFGYCCTVIKDGLHHTPPKHQEGVNFVSTQHVRNRQINIDDATFISTKAYKEGHPRIRPQAGDVLITLVGSIGFAALVEEIHMPLSFTRHVGYVRCIEQKLNPQYLINYSESFIFKCFIEKNVSQTAQPSIYLSSLAAHKLPLPPIDEQQKIVNWISANVIPYDQAIANAEREIHLFGELRQVIVSDAVTGKIKL
jgi:type I restriction enzyme, S subunit